MQNSSSGNNANKGLAKIAQQRMMRGNMADANLINNFGSTGVGAGRQALNAAIRGNDTSKNTINNSDINKTQTTGKNIVNTDFKKSEEKTTTGKSVLGALGL